MIIYNYETTEFSNNNFAIIGRILYIATQYEKTFRAYFNGLACKYLPWFVKEIDEFSRIELTNDFMANMKEVLNTSSKLSFHRLISIFFEKIINKAKISCENSGISVFEHFIDVNKLSKRANEVDVYNSLALLTNN